MSSEGFSSPESRLESLMETALDILAKLIEQIGSLDPQQIQDLRQQLSETLNEIGINDPKNLVKLATKLVQYKNNPPKPKKYPDKNKFKKIFSENQIEWKNNHPELFDNLQLRGGGDLLTYLYGLGILMTCEIAYKEIFKNDPIEVERGTVTNGRHRELTKLILEKARFPISTLNWL